MDRKAEGNPNAVESWCHSAVSIRVRNPVSSAMARRPSRLLARHSKWQGCGEASLPATSTIRTWFFQATSPPTAK